MAMRVLHSKRAIRLFCELAGLDPMTVPVEAARMVAQERGPIEGFAAIWEAPLPPVHRAELQLSVVRLEDGEVLAHYRVRDLSGRVVMDSKELADHGRYWFRQMVLTDEQIALFMAIKE